MPTDAPTTRDRDAETRQDAAARRLRWAYITGLCIIAGLATTKAIVSSAILERARHDAAVINVAGRQRMLSQKIAKAALRYEHAATVAEVQSAHDELQTAANEWAGSHQDLRFGSEERGIPTPSEPEIAEAYAQLQASFDRVRNAAAALLVWEETHGLADQRAPEVLRAIDTILQYESVFLPEMHAIVGMHETAAREHVAGLVQAKNILLAVTLVALLLEILIVFEPAVRTMSRRLREANTERRRAEALARHKTDFLANMSHEIRTPMTAILGYADLLLEPEITPTQRSEHIQTIRTNGEHLLSLINDILDMSKIEAGMLDVERVACHPAQIIEDTLSLMRHKAHQKGLTIEASADGPVPETIAADPLRIRQILVNLVGNAIKFTSSGSVRVITSVTERADQHWLDIAVSDTGIGVAPDVLARIFEAFGQAESNT
ncbi:MAG: histidine kinase dimerization/phospho-acceptor domain-containing protein, partial [Planctomycetota bacterium]